MAPKPQSLQPTTEKHENQEPSSEEDEESGPESGSESDSSHEVKTNLPNEEDEEGPSEDEEDPSEDEEDPSEDEEDDQVNLETNKIPTPVPQIEEKSVAQQNGSDSESDSDDSPSAYKLQPISETPLAAKKRTHQESDSVAVESSKKAKIKEKKSLTSTPGGGMGVITRLWSDEDEIVVLNGMVDFKNVKGVDPYADMGAFHNFVKGKLQVDFSKDQLRTKLNRLKKRFFNAMKKCGNGSDPVFSKAHEDMLFELSKRIWGGGVGNTNEVRENVKKDVAKVEKTGVGEKRVAKSDEDCEGGFDWSDYPFLSGSIGNLAGNFPSLAMSNVGMSFMKERLSLIGNAKAEELNEKWKQLIAEEAEVNHKMVNLMMEQVKMALDQ